MFYRYLQCLLCLCLPMQMWSQSACSDFDFTLTTTPSTCQANGSVTYSLTTNENDFYNYQFSIVSGANVQPTQNLTITNLPQGTYLVRVTAQCKSNQQTVAVQKQVTIPGSYRVPVLSYNASKSRPSYILCPTGSIVFDQRGGLLGTYTLTAAPAGVSVPQDFVPVAEGMSWRLPGENYPPGNYVIHYRDACDYQLDLHLTLPVKTPLPIPRQPSISQRWASQQHTCTHFPINLQLNPQHPNYNIWQQMIADGEVEVALAEENQPVPEGNWRNYENKDRVYLPLPGQVVRYYQKANNSHKKMQLLVRNKTCPDLVERYAIEGLPTFHISWTTQGHPSSCDSIDLRLTLNYNMSRYACMPITVRFYDLTTNALVQEKTSNDQWGYFSCYLPLNRRFRMEVWDGNQNKIEESNMGPYGLWLDVFTNLPSLPCNQYALRYQLRRFASCVPVEVEIWDDVSKTLVYSKIHQTVNEELLIQPYFTYGRRYRWKVKKVTGTTIVESTWTTNRPNLNFAARFDTHLTQKGYARFVPLNMMENMALLPNTQLELRGPEGFTTQTVTISQITNTHALLSETYNPFQWARMPAGEYQLVFKDLNRPDCPEVIKTYVYKGGYEVKGLAFTQVENSCELKAVMHGMITLGGEELPNNTYFRILEGPSTTHDRQAKLREQEIYFGTQGRYLVGIQLGGNIAATPYDTIAVYLESHPLRLSKEHTTAFICTDAEHEQGNILVKAIGGVPPYRYELWDENNTTKLLDNPAELDDGVIHFVQGKKNDKFMVHVIDKCGTFFTQAVQIANPGQMQIITSPDLLHCVGGTIQLSTSLVGSYEWKGPNGFQSTAQSIVIPNATRRHSGTYTLRVFPLACGSMIEASKEILIEPCWAPVNPNLMHKVESQVE